MHHKVRPFKIPNSGLAAKMASQVKMLVTQVQGPEFHPQSSHKRRRRGADLHSF